MPTVLNRLSPIRPLRILALAGMLALVSSPALADSAYQALLGTWRGEGRVEFDGGKSEKITCNTYYVDKESGKLLSLVIRCANPSGGKIEMRGMLKHQDGKLDGTWEERTYNADGTASGGIIGNQIQLSFRGAVNGTLTTLITDDSQTVFVRSEGSGISMVSIVLKKQAPASTAGAQQN